MEIFVWYPLKNEVLLNIKINHHKEKDNWSI